MNKPYFLETSRLGFRHWTKKDIRFAKELWEDNEVMKYHGGPLNTTTVRHKLTTEMQVLRQYKVQYWPVFLSETGEFVGCCGLCPYREAERIYKVEVYIKSAYWGQGYGLEAVVAVILHAIGVIGVNALFAEHHPENVAAKAMLIRFGFERLPDGKRELPAYLLRITTK